MQDKQLWLDLDQLTQRLCIIAAEQLGFDPGRVKPESRIIEDLHCDSLDAVELIMETEDEFDLTIPATPATPVGKLIFTRSPFRIRDLAEFAFLNQNTGSPARVGRRGSRTTITSEREREFSQLGGRWSGEVGPDGNLIEVVGSHHPYPMFRRGSDGMMCVQLPSAVAAIGSDGHDAQDDEKPSHFVSVSSFLMDLEPVSVTAFCRFLNSIDAASEEQESLIGLSADDDRELHLQFAYNDDRWIPKAGVQRQPVVMVSWFAANAYSLWANACDWHQYKTHDGFLPTEAQWEYAAQGAFDDPQLVQAGMHQRGDTYENGALPIADVDQFLGISKFCVRHMSGTIWHWCRDWFDPNFYTTPEAMAADPVNRHQTASRSERGGSWVGPMELCRPSYRRGRNPVARGRCLGFRCVRPLSNAHP